jgi:uncharacterized protein
VAQSAGLHEPAEKLQPATVDRHRALVSIQEELEAVDWYDQRVDATDAPELAEILAHNRDEEKEHAAMTLEWLRRHDPTLDRHLRTYLFTSDPILEIEEEQTETEVTGSASAPGGSSSGRSDSSLGLGSLKGHE